MTAERDLPAGDFSSWLRGMQAAIKGSAAADVPCGGCTACCTSSQFVHIDPDETDALAHIPAGLLFPAPGQPRGHVLLGYDERGHCPMLVDGRCSIYQHRPRTCRAYDCRIFAAVGLDVDAEDEHKEEIARQARRWRFSFPADDDRRRHAAVRAAARSVRATSVTQLAVRAVEHYEEFALKADKAAPPGPRSSTVSVGSGAVAVRPEIAPDAWSEELEQYRRPLTGYCYRMLGSAFEADDAVQDTLVRAWKNMDSFEGRSTVRSWLYRIATNVCLDMLRGRQRRARPMDMGPSHSADDDVGPMLAENLWVTPVPDDRVVPPDGNPEDLALARESIRLAFVTALQHLPARQRAVLILREVLRWQATEVAELLDTTVASVNSALQRARATLALLPSRPLDGDPPRPEAMNPEQAELLARYVEAFERYDITSLVALLHEDAVMSMPPYNFWLQGPEEMGRWFLGQGIGCCGSRLVATAANGQAAFGSYRPDADGGWTPWAIQVLDVVGGRIVGHHNFLDTDLFAVFGLPARLDAAP
jgi:RNA polymerase sigma-70 factor (ECF subfamily)